MVLKTGENKPPPRHADLKHRCQCGFRRHISSSRISSVLSTAPVPQARRLNDLFPRKAGNLAFVQAQTDDLECKICACKQALTAARDKQTQLQRSSITLSTRSAEAAAVLATLSACAPPCPGAPPAPPAPPAPAAPPDTHAPASASGISASATAAAARACLVHRDTPATSAATSAAASHSADTSACSYADARTTAVVPLMSRQRLGSFYDPPGRDAWDKAPRAIDSFRCCAGISYDDLHAVDGGSSDVVDFSRYSIVSLIEKASRRKVARLTDSGAGISGEDICWFAQMHYDAAPGVPFSSSATISSPECLASLAIQIQLSRLDYALVNAAAESIHAYGSVATTQPASEEPAFNQAPRRPPPAHTFTTPASAPTFPVASGPSLDVPASGRSAGTATEAAAHEGSAVVELAADTARRMPPRWSGRVRCGVNDTYDGRAAVRWAVRSLLRRFCTLVPWHTTHELLGCFHVAMLRTLANARQGGGASGGGGGDVPDPRRSRVGGSLEEFLMQAVVAALGATHVLAEEIAAVASLRVLQDLVRSSQTHQLRPLLMHCASIVPASCQILHK